MRSRMSGVTARTFSGDAMEAGLLEKRLEVAAEFLDGQRANVLGVEPDCLRVEGIVFREVHHRVGAVDALKREQVANLVQSQKFAVVLRRPAQQAEKIDEGLRQKAGIAISGDADDGAVLALGKLGAIGRDEQRKMRELRRLGARDLRR